MNNEKVILDCKTQDDLISIINSQIKSYQYTKIRFFERNKSYEDFTVSYSLAGTPIYNFSINSTPSGDTVVRKKSKNSTRHIRFDISKGCSVKPKKKILEIIITDDVYYTDGTHRYNK